MKYSRCSECLLTNRGALQAHYHYMVRPCLFLEGALKPYTQHIIYTLYTVIIYHCKKLGKS